MVDRPILFSAPMIRALLDGRKTMTRRLRWRREPSADRNDIGMGESIWCEVEPGDRLWVREAFCQVIMREIFSGRPGDRSAMYRATDSHLTTLSGPPKWKPSIHMPRWASRLTLTVAAKRIEPLQMIRRSDCIAEGVTAEEMRTAGTENPALLFQALWESLHGAGSWAANPEVVVISFAAEKRNIDAR